MTKRKPFILLVRFSTLGCRQNEEKKEKENGRKDYVKLVEATVEVQGIWPQSLSHELPSTTTSKGLWVIGQ